MTPQPQGGLTPLPVRLSPRRIWLCGRLRVRGSDPLCRPTCCTAGCSRPPRSTCSAAGRRRGRGCGRPTGRSSRCRSTAGSAPPTRPTGRCWRSPRRRCSTSAAGPGATSPRCGAPASSRSASTSPPSPCGSRAGAAAAAIPGDVFGAVPGAGRWRTALLLDGNVGIGGAPAAAAAPHARAAGARRDRARRARPAGRADAAHADPDRGPGVVSEWFAWARVGVDGIEPLARRRRARRRRHAVAPAGAGSRVCGGHEAPPGPFQPAFWRSPLRGPWLTAALGTVLLVLVAIVAADRLPLARGLRARTCAATRSCPPAPTCRSTSAGRRRRRGCTRSPRGCTSTSGWSRCRSCWPSCGR